MTVGFDSNNPLICEGIIGDGCGGGRYFIVEDNSLKAYDPQSEKFILLLENITMPQKISKKGCIVSIKCETQLIKFDLSSMSIIS